MNDLYIAPASRLHARDLAGEGNSFDTRAEAHRSATAMNATCPLEGDAWVVVTRGPGGGLEVDMIGEEGPAMPDPCDYATAAIELNEQLTHRGFETLTAAELRALADSSEGLDSMIDDLHKTSPLPATETGAVLPELRAEIRAMLRDWLVDQAEERGETEALPREYVILGDEEIGIDTDEDLEAAKAQLLAHGILSAPVYRGHGADQVKTSLVLFAREADAEVWRC